MRKLFFIAIVLVAFAFSAMAQTESQTSGTSGQSSTTTTTTKKTRQHKASSETSGQAGEAASAQGAKESKLTGCISAKPNDEGVYTLTNGRYKKGVELGGQDLSAHAGHKVQLTGMWEKSGAAVGETEKSGEKQTGERHFKVTDVKHIADTCAPAGGAAASSAMPHHRSKKGSAGTAETTPGSTTPKL